jgi:hypothetical protein
MSSWPQSNFDISSNQNQKNLIEKKSKWVKAKVAMTGIMDSLAVSAIQ